VVQHQAQASASTTQASASASELKHISATEALSQRINSLISANENAVRESHNASNAALVAQRNVFSTAATLQKVLEKQSTLPTAVTGQGVLSKKTMERNVATTKQTLYNKDYIYENDPFAMLNDVDSLTSRVAAG
jgi:hypothetical protein